MEAATAGEPAIPPFNASSILNVTAKFGIHLRKLTISNACSIIDTTICRSMPRRCPSELSASHDCRVLVLPLTVNRRGKKESTLRSFNVTTANFSMFPALFIYLSFNLPIRWDTPHTDIFEPFAPWPPGHWKGLRRRRKKGHRSTFLSQRGRGTANRNRNCVENVLKTSSLPSS